MAKRLVAVGSSYISATSLDDGSTWSYGALPPIAGYTVADGGAGWMVAAGVTHLVAVAKLVYPTEGPTNVSAYSLDGLSWTEVTLPSTQLWGRPVWAVDRFVIPGQSSIVWSTTGAVWTEVPYGFTLPHTTPTTRPQTATFGDNVIVVSHAALGMYMATSPDKGATWITRDTATTVAGTAAWLVTRESDVLITSSGTPHTRSVTFPFAMTTSVDGSFVVSGSTLAANSTRAITTAQYGNMVYADNATGIPTWGWVPGAVPFSDQNACCWTGESFISVGNDSGGAPEIGVGRSLDGLVWASVTSLSPPPTAYGFQDWHDIAVQDVPTAFDGLSSTLGLESSVDSSPSQYTASIEEALTVAISFSCASLFQGAISDMLVLLSDGSVVYPVSASMVSELELQDGGARGVYDPYDAVNNPTQFNVDTTTGAVSIYTGFDFAQYASVEQDLYGVRSDGVYLIRGTTDAGMPIDAGLDLGVTTMGTTKAKNIEAVYLGLSTDGSAYVRATARGQESVYRVVHRGPILRAVLAKGVTDRAWGVKIDITGATYADLDVVELFTGVNTRRWTR